MLKNLSNILWATIFIAAFPLVSTTLDERVQHFDRNFFMGLGPNFGSKGALGLAQLGVGFSLFHNNFDFQVGPLVNIVFGKAFFLDLDFFIKAKLQIPSF